MKNKTQFICTVTVLAAFIACAGVNFSNAFSGAEVSSSNIAATGLFLIFWLLLTRFRPAAKVSIILSIFLLTTSVVGFCATTGDWFGLGVKVITFPTIAVFYALSFISSWTVFYIITAAISFAILVFSLISLANNQPKSK